MGVALTGLVVRGTTYSSLSEAAAAIPCNPNQITEYKRKKQCSVEQAIRYFVERVDSLTFEGKVWHSAKDYIISKGWDYVKINTLRSKKGLTWQQAIDAYLNPVESEDSTARWLQDHGIDVNRFYKVRKKLGLSTDECKKLVVSQPDLVEAPKAPEGAKVSKTGTGKNMVYAVRCNKCHRLLSLTPGEFKAFRHSEEFCREHEREPIIRRQVGDKKYKVGDLIGLTLNQAIEAVHVSRQTFDRLCNDSDDIQGVLDTLYSAWLEKDKGPWEVNGVHCESKADVARALNMPLVTLCTFLNKDCTRTVQDAITHYLTKDNTPEAARIRTARIIMEKYAATRIAAYAWVDFFGVEKALEKAEKYPKALSTSISRSFIGNYDCIIDDVFLYLPEDIAGALGCTVEQVYQARKYATEGHVSFQQIINRYVETGMWRSRKIKPWSEAEVALLKADYPKVGYKVNLPGRTRQDIQVKASSLGLKKEESKWTEAEVAILKAAYSQSGPDIPELRSKYTASAITQKAGKLGLSFVGRFNLWGVTVNLTDAVRMLGINSLTPGAIAEQFGCTIQEALAIISLSYQKKPEVVRVAHQFASDESAYVHAGGLRWSVAKYCECFNMSRREVDYVRGQYNLSADAAVLRLVPDAPLQMPVMMYVDIVDGSQKLLVQHHNRLYILTQMEYLWVMLGRQDIEQYTV